MDTILKTKLSEILKEKHMTQEELARVSGLHPITISRIKRNTTHEPYRENVARIIAALGITLDELFGLNGK